MDDFVLKWLKDEQYRVGDIQVVPYHRNSSLFPDGYLSQLYFALAAGRRSSYRRENLQAMMCGMTDLSHDAVCSYLASQKLWVMGQWREEVFHTGGIVWPVSIVGGRERVAFCAYGFIRWTWGTIEQELMSWLGQATLFVEYDLSHLHAQRYADNNLSGQYLKKFGWTDCGTVPKMLARGDGVVDGVVSTLPREVFIDKISEFIRDSTL